MTRYFIHVVSDDGPQTDEIGQEFSSPKLAIQETARAAGEMMRSEAPDCPGERHIELTLADDAANTIALVSVSIRIPGRG